LDAAPEIGAQLRKMLFQVASLDQFHTEIRLALELTDFVDGYDARMIERGCRLGLGAEALQRLGGGHCARQDHLERDISVQRQLPGTEDYSHASMRNLLEQFIVA